MGSGGDLVGNMLARLWATRLQAAADGSAAAPEGIDRGGRRSLVRRARARRRAAARLRADRRRPLEPDLPGQRRRRPQLGAAPAAARQAPRLRPRHGAASTRSSRRSAPTEVPVAPVVGLCEDESVNGAPFYVMEFVEGPILRGLAEAEAFPDEADRRAIGERVADTLVAIHAVDPDAVGLGDLGRKEDYVARQLRRWQGQWEKSKTRELAAIDARPRAPRRPHPRAGPGDDRPRRLPPRQHDPHPGRRGRRGGRLGALHARRPARRRRPADGLLARARRGDDRPRPAGQPGARLPHPRGAGAPATPSAPAATSPSSTSSSPSATGSWRSSSRASTPATPPAATARSTRASRPSPTWSSAWPKRPRAPSAATEAPSSPV